MFRALRLSSDIIKIDTQNIENFVAIRDLL